MTNMSSPTEKRKLLPDVVVKDIAGQTYRLWDFRQKTHVTLFYDPAASMEARTLIEAEIAARQKTWNWLGVKILVLSEMPVEFPVGVYLVDRYGYLIAHYSDLSMIWDEIEKEYLYLEARQC